jgi:uncharacterized protein YndB with AHSA1/START domain
VEYVSEYLEVVRPHRLVFALLAEKYSLNFERVSVVFDAQAVGCALRLTHETKPEFAEQARRDWAKILEWLAAMLSDTGRNAALTPANWCLNCQWGSTHSSPAGSPA